MTDYPSLHMIIDGEKVSGGGRRTFDVVNPATGEAIGALPLAEAADLDRALETAQKGFAIWRKSSSQDRAAVLSGAARLLLERREDIARIATMEEGKPLAETRIEVLVVAGLFNFYAGEGFPPLWPRPSSAPPASARPIQQGAGRPRRRLRAVELSASAIPAENSARRSPQAAR